jgi:hypothetical protein
MESIEKMNWSRQSTLWKQGSILARENFQEVELVNVADADLAVAISHDCDIANDNLDAEPAVEFILARIVEKRDGNFALGKNPRTLHLSYTQEESSIVLELSALKKIAIHKNILVKLQPNYAYQIAEPVYVLSSWLALRYRRLALPNSLVNRLKPVFDRMEEVGKKNSAGVLSFQLFYDPKEELPPEEEYELSLIIVYTTDDTNHEEMATAMAKDIKNKFSNLLEKTKKFGTVYLRKCEAVSEMEFTLKDARETEKYALEHVSYRTDPPGSTV